MDRRDFLKLSALVPVLAKFAGGVSFFSETPALEGYIPIMRVGQINALNPFMVTTHFMREIEARFQKSKRQQLLPPIQESRSQYGKDAARLGYIEDLKYHDGKLYAKPALQNPEEIAKGSYWLSSEVLVDRPELLAVALIEERFLFPDLPKLQLGK